MVGYSIIDTWNTKVRVRLQAKNSYKCRPGVMEGMGQWNVNGQGTSGPSKGMAPQGKCSGWWGGGEDRALSLPVTWSLSLVTQKWK